jgi:hypothetical protein
VPEEHETLLRSRLIPAAYLSRVIGRTSDAEHRATLAKSLGHLLVQVQPVPTLSDAERARLQQAAFGCADLFQRAERISPSARRTVLPTTQAHGLFLAYSSPWV